MKVMNLNRVPNYIIISVLLHGLMLFGYVQLKHNPIDVFLAGVEPHKQIMNFKLLQEVVEPELTLPKKKVRVFKQDKIIPKPKISSAKPIGSKSLNKQKLNAYTMALKSFVEKNKVYPRMARRLRHSGLVKVKLNINPDGKFDQIEIISPSAFNTINKGTVKFLKKLGQFKPLPEELVESKEFIIPIDYKLARRGR